MPIYEYQCRSCGVVFELFRGIGNHDDAMRCKVCGSSDLEKLMSSASVTIKDHGPDHRLGTCCGQGISCEHPKRCCEN